MSGNVHTPRPFSDELRARKKSGEGELIYCFVLEEEKLCVEILENLDGEGEKAGGTFTRGPVPLAQILDSDRELSNNNNDRAFWESILAHQGLT